MTRARPPLWRTLPLALRPHQWAKNALLFLPALAAHVDWSVSTLRTLGAGFLAFSLLASAVYLVNDLLDMPHDRAHPTKRLRPIAAGQLSVPVVLAAVGGLLVLSGLLARGLTPRFQGVLLAYLGLTTAYSLWLKRLEMVDVITLATLYATRIVAGAALTAVPLSRWFLAFSVFFFFSLALVKRVTELLGRPSDAPDRVAGRGYRSEDLPMLRALGSAAVSASSLVYCLYITSDEVGRLYSSPDFLWLGLPILLYWQARVWMLASRHAIEEDPVTFALKDHVSYLAAAGFLAIVWMAS
jgi:4-hydroxybenzoate polyprenyltransferase